ncbi:MAG: MBOAT family O-acyltransferase, partial [Erysipelotrichaceae bacterium]
DIFTLDIMFKNVFVPMGISFFTFQYIALLMDIYRKKVVNINLLDFSVFTTFFPKIVQGPIMLYPDFDEQFNNPGNHKINFENMSSGLYLLSVGFTKKILIADVLAKLVNAGYAQYASLNTTMTIIVVVLYSFQIYFDFSGYSDIALGLGKMFNIHYPHNFNSPYKATSIGDFWNRWHISLTNFFTRYLYIPLGGNRKGKTRTLINIMIVFLISGLWHGAAITFIIWGLIHGILSVIDKLIDNPYQRLPHIIKWAITFICVTLAWIYFRSPNLEVANTMISNIFSFNNFNLDHELLKLLLLPEITFIITQYSLEPYTFRFILIFILSIFFATLFTKNTTQIVSGWKPKLSRLLVCSFLLCWCILEFGKSAVFLYERF